MAQLNVRLPDDFYKAIQAVLDSKLKTDISCFVRRILLDTLLIYSDPSSIEAALSRTGLKYEARGRPDLILYMTKDWRLSQDEVGQLKGELDERMLKILDRYLLGPLGRQHSLSRLEHLLASDLQAILAKEGKPR